MKSKHLLLMLLLALGLPWAANAQSQLNEGFESTTFPPEDWASIHVSGANYWARYTTYKHSGDASAYAHWAGSGHENYLITPKLAPASDESLSFYVAAQSYSGTTLYVKVSTTTADASAFSTTLATYTTGSSGTIGTTSTSTWVEKTIDLSDYVGQQIFIAFHVVDNNGGDVIIDDVTGVTLYVASCAKPTGLAVNNGVATWNAGTASQWNLKYKKVSDETWISVNGLTAASYTFSGLDAATDYEVQVQTDCGGGDLSDWTNSASFTTPCDAYDIPYTYGFEEAARFDCWTPIAGVTRQTSYVNNGSYSLKFSGTTSNMIALPQFNEATNNLRVEFWTRPESNGGSSGKFVVGYMTDLSNANSFVPVGEVYNSTSWASSPAYEKKTVDFNVDGVPANAYIAMRQYECSTYYYWFVDDVTVKEIPSCLEPADLAEVPNTATSNSVTFGWTAVNNETTWKVQYKKSDATDWTTVSDPVTTNPYTLPGLDHSSTYQVRVAAWCTPSNPEGISGYTEPITVHTECEAVTTFPWTENFESYAAGNFSDPCWLNEHLVSVSGRTDVFKVYTNTNGTNSTHQLQLPDMQDGNTVKLRLPEMNLPNNNYQFTIDFYRNDGSYGSYTTEGVSVFASTNGEIEGATLLAFIPRPHSASNSTGTTTIPNETAAGWYTYELPIGVSGTCYIILRGESRYGTSSFMDNLVVEQIPTCRKPSNLVCTAKTAHTATLSWTNGAEGQNAWQIAYSTTADFDPSTVTPVDVTTNPTTIEGLAQSTTYYAYVRANCGGDDYSAWCNNKVTFSTVAGNVTPTGLAVNASTITSDEALATWNAVAGNTLHEYYQIYWAEATVTSVPDEPAAPNLITNITATSQLISGLNPETQYKVWVRDICGTDGNSNWSSAVTFTTAASCQNPDGLAASNVTNESATITWNTYGQEGFNLQYRISGEEWDANNIIPNVSTPYTLNPPLIGSTTYEVRVQAACTTDDSWSSALSFKTQCDPVSFPWSENFDEWESKSECWSFLSGQYNNGNGPATTYSSAWTLNSSYGSYITLSGKALTMNLYSTYKYWAVTPIIDITTDDALLTVDVAVAAWSSATPNFDDNDTLAFAISTNGGATFTSLRVLDGAELNTLGNSYTTIYVPVTGYNGQAVRFAIFGGSINNVSSNDNRCVIDNVTVMETPSCYPVGTLSAATDVTYNSAKLSWALVDDTQDEWTVQYATNATFTEGVGTETATTNTNYELTDLTPETHYWVRVKAACSTTDDWSNAVDFTTDVFCAVTGLTAGTTTQTTADLSWTGASDSYNIQYRTAAVPTTTQLFTEGFETYADESALEAVWAVLDLGDGENTAELGLYDGAKKTGNYGFRFSSYDGSSSGDFDQYLISPELTKAGLLEFAYKSSSGTSDKFRVGYSSTTNDVSAFTWGAETNSASSWQTYSETMPEDAKYFAINYTAVYQFRLYIDDIAIYEMQPAGTWQNASSETASKQLTGLAAGTKYDVQVQGVCGGTAGSWSTPIYSFTTLPFTKTITGVGNDNWDEQNGGYYLIASPVTNAITPSADNGFVTSNYDLYAFDQSEELEWRNYNVLVETEMTHPNFTTIENGKGYLYASKTNTTLSFTGEVNTNGTVTLSKSGSGNLAGWNLVGTPFGEDAYITKPFYTLENSNTFTSNVAGTAIHAMQGLFVVADNDGETLTFTTEAPSKSAKLNMNLRSGDKQLDNAILVFGGEQQLGKFSFSANSSKIYMPVEGKEYAVATAEGNVGEMPVSFKAEKNGSYTLSFTNEEVTFSYLHLIDNMTGNDVNLLETPNYTFEARTSDYANRFRLVFATGSSVDGDSFGFVNASGNLCIFGIEGEATVQVIDMLGHVISSETFSGSYERKINGAPGVYLIRLINGNDVKVQKLVVR